MTTDKTPSLAARLLKAQQSISHIAPDATNNFHKYKYVRAETLIAVCRDALHEQGLVLMGGDFTIAETSLKQDTKQGPQPVIRCRRAATLMCRDSPEQHLVVVEWLATPDSGRPIDKACGVASTAGLGYLLRDLLQIPRVDEDPNDDAYDRRRQDADREEARPMTDDQHAEIKRLVEDLGINGKAAYLARMGRKEGMPETQGEAESDLVKLRALVAERDAAGSRVKEKKQ